MHSERLLERAEARREAVSEALDTAHRAEWGQFFTPAPVADFLADLIVIPDSGRFVVLDPGAGTGSLSAAIVAKAIREDASCQMHVVGFEADPALHASLAETYADCEGAASATGVKVTTELRQEDFLYWAVEQAAGLRTGTHEKFDACVMNPPYRKVSTGTADRLLLERLGLRITNLYAGFLGATVELLAPDGQLSAITPRSFANGPYFLPFRRFFLSRMAFSFMHVYERRGHVFADSDVLQENVVFRAVKTRDQQDVTLSHSLGFVDEPVRRNVASTDIVSPADPQLFIHVPIGDEAIEVAHQMLELPATLGAIGIKVSTGRVVDFRTRDNLLHDHDPDADAAPLIYPSHLCNGRVDWPQLDARKPNALEINADTSAMLLPVGSYCLVKRFTAKEERRRVVAALFDRGDVPSTVVAFENHLNVFHDSGRPLEPSLAAGLVALLNSTPVDAYVRQFSGHTQINATDLRRLRYPDRDTLIRLGESGCAVNLADQAAIDELVSEHVAGFGPARATAQAA